MNPENTNQEQEEVQVEQKSQLHQVTPLSKYLAMTLFIILPFLGGWIGYTFAPEKVVEMERVIEVEKMAVEEVASEVIVPEEQLVNREIASFNPNTVTIGDQSGEFTLISDESVRVFDRQLRFGADEAVAAMGTISVAWSDFAGSVLVSFLPAEEAHKNIPQSEVTKNNIKIERYTMGALTSFPDLKNTIEKMYSVDFNTDMNTTDSIKNLNHNFEGAEIMFKEVEFSVGRNGNEPWYVASASLGEFTEITFE